MTETQEHVDADAKAKRAEKWEAGFIACKNHPERRCNRSLFVANRTRRCGSCKNRRADGSRNDAHIRFTNKRNYDLSMRRRRTGRTATSLQGLKLFARCTGMNILGAY